MKGIKIDRTRQNELYDQIKENFITTSAPGDWKKNHYIVDNAVTLEKLYFIDSTPDLRKMQSYPIYCIILLSLGFLIKINVYIDRYCVQTIFF